MEGTVQLVDHLGFTVHPVKSVFQPSQVITFLGYIIDSITMTVRLTEERAKDLQDLCIDALHKHHISIRDFAKIIGKMVASKPGVQYVQLFYNDLEIFKDNTCMLKRSCGNYDTKIQLTSEIKTTLQWWIQNIRISFKPIAKNDPDIV